MAELDFPKHLVDLAKHLRATGISATRRLDYDLAQEAAFNLCRALTTPNPTERAQSAGDALETLAVALGHHTTAQEGVMTPRVREDELSADPSRPISDDLSALQIPCPRCKAWELVATSSRYPLKAYCRVCGETSELK